MEPFAHTEQHTPTGPWNEFPDSHWQAYFGKQAPYYMLQLERVRNGSWPSFNFPAFILGFFWMAYRRMYLVAVCAFMLLLLEGTLEEGFIWLMGWEGSNADWFGRLFGLFINLLMGSFANRVYLWDARRNIREAISKGPLHIEELRLAQIAEKGGTSWGAVIAILVLSVLFVLVWANVQDMANAF